MIPLNIWRGIWARKISSPLAFRLWGRDRIFFRGMAIAPLLLIGAEEMEGYGAVKFMESDYHSQ